MPQSSGFDCIAQTNLTH